MAGSGLLMPSGSGGLMRYNQEYKSKFMLSPTHVVVIIVTVVLGLAILKIMF